MRKTLFALLAAAPITLAAQNPVPPAAEQIAAAILPLPADMRDAATVMGYKTAGKLEVLREGKPGGMHCLALYVVRTNFHVACYHSGLEAFMLRGRQLREQGVTNADSVDAKRFAEIKSGALKMPAVGALYSLTGPKTGWDAATLKLTGASPLGVVYMPGATTESTGIPTNPATKGPWLMFPGSPKAHIMLVGSMQ